MRFAIVDDEIPVLEKISQKIKKLLPHISVQIDSYSEPNEFLKNYTPFEFDCLFLDIDMPDMDGFELAKKLRNEKDDVPIVYITGRDDLITHAFRYRPIGFVRKQHIDAELSFALTTIIDEIKKKDTAITVTEIRSLGAKNHTIAVKNILFIESFKHNVDIHLIDGQKLTVREKLSYYQEQNGFENFVMINNGTLINLAHVTIVGDVVKFENGDEMFISRRRIKEVLQAYLNYVKKVLI